MDVLVTYEGRRGRARRAAEAVAEAAATHGVATLVRPMDDVEARDIANAAAVIAGCWTPGNIPFGGEPTVRMTRWIDGLGPFDGKHVGVYCTYGFFPHTFADTAARTAETLNELSQGFELRGAKVVATRSIYVKKIDAAAADLVGRVLEHVPES